MTAELGWFVTLLLVWADVYPVAATGRARDLLVGLGFE